MLRGGSATFISGGSLVASYFVNYEFTHALLFVFILVLFINDYFVNFN